MSILNCLKKYRQLNPKKLFEVSMSIIVVCLITMGAVYDSGMKEITILRSDAFADTSESFTSKTRQENVYGFLKEKGISIAEDEILGSAMTDTLKNGDTLEIRQGKAITVSADGTVRRVLTSKNNVVQALVELGIEVGDYDWAEPAFESEITEGMFIRLRRITVQEENVTERFQGPEEVRTDDTMFEDEKVVAKGADGEKQVVYRIYYEEGNELYREISSEIVTKEPELTVVTVGTKVRQTAVKQGRTFSYSRKITMKATAYDTSPEENGGYTTTATGTSLGFGVVAVDPKVIPLGSRLYVESTDDGASFTYGYCIAADTGGAIKGNRIDLCYNTRSQCIQFGRRNVTVYVLD